MKKITIHINQDPYHFEKATLTPDEFRAQVGAPSGYEVWKIVKDPDPEGQLPVDDLQVTAEVEIKSGERYRVVPVGTFGLIPAQLSEEVEKIRQEGVTIEVQEAEGWLNVVMHDHPVPAHYGKRKTALLLKLPMSYPNGKPDMFWADEDLTLKDGRIPQGADQIESALGRRWRRFSWHLQQWNPGTDNLRTYIEFIADRLGRKQ